MADSQFEIKVKGADKLAANLDKFGKEIATGFEGAGKQAAYEITRTRGLGLYPPMTAANLPPEPYYIRGRGTQYIKRNAGNSERFGTQLNTSPSEGFFSKHIPGRGTIIGNRASYAKWLAGADQATHMKKIGWRKLYDVAKEKLGKVKQIYQGWVDKLIRDLKL